MSPAVTPRQEVALPSAAARDGEPPTRPRITRPAQRRIRLALALVLFGLSVQLLTSLHWTPLTFVLSTVVGIGPILLGSAIFLWAVWRSVEPEVER